MKELKSAKPGNPIPTRSQQAIDDLVDLTHFYTTSLKDDWTGNPKKTLASFPTGVHAFHRAAFDIRGLIQLAGATSSRTDYDYPKSVKDIPVHFEGEKIDFLHGTIGEVDPGTLIGSYTLHYANGASRDIPIIYERDVRDTFIPYDKENPVQLISAHAVDAGNGLFLYVYTVNNPLPKVEVQSIDFTSAMTASAPFLVAVTMETFKTCMEHEWFDSIRIYNELVPRDPNTKDNLIDLSNYFMASPDDDWFNHAGHDLHDLPRGIQDFGGVEFDTRGLMVLGGAKTSLKITGLALPEELKGIKIKQKGKTVNFLHACAFDSPRGTKISDYVIRYANGQTETIPIRYGEHVMDWWERKEEGTLSDPKAKAVWYGSNAATRKVGLRTRVCMYQWENPHPDWEIVSIDWISALANSAPILFAITVN